MADNTNITVLEQTHEVVLANESETQVSVSPNHINVIQPEAIPETHILTIVEQGPPGAPGEKGEPGEKGIDSFYIHRQDTPSREWMIIHNLNKYPSVTVVDSANSTVFGDCFYIDGNSLRLTFSAAFSGSAYLN